MNTIYYGGDTWRPHIFLAGPTQRVPGNTSWRQHCLHLLSDKGFEGDVILPEWHNGGDHEKNKKKIGWDVPGTTTRWEKQYLTSAKLIIFWLPFTLIPGDMSSLPGLTTRLELGIWLEKDPEKLIVGMPVECNLGDGPIKTYSADYGVRIYSTLEAVVDTTIQKFSKYTYTVG